MALTCTELKPVTLKINGVEHEYSIAVSDCKSWEDTLNYMVILNKKGKSVYRNKTHGNRIAILINYLYMTDQALYVTHNGTEYIYVPTMDVLVSRATKKVCWEDKNNPQRRVIVHNAMSEWLKIK